jgi:hypothetical protein
MRVVLCRTVMILDMRRFITHPVAYRTRSYSRAVCKVEMVWHIFSEGLQALAFLKKRIYATNIANGILCFFGTYFAVNVSWASLRVVL